MSLRKLLLATRSSGKLRELIPLLEREAIQLVALGDVPGVPDAEESGRTFEENARIKASHAARTAQMWALGEDSGLEVDALDGRPGIYSARYAGKHGDDAANNAKLVRELSRFENRSARYVCVMALADPQGRIAGTARGVCEGQILLEPRGSGGFGYDPHFLPEAGNLQTMAELDAEMKSALSHRGQALRAMLTMIRLHVVEGSAGKPPDPAATQALR
jgi:XTP/dITP diphosphohydrolase